MYQFAHGMIIEFTKLNGLQEYLPCSCTPPRPINPLKYSNINSAIRNHSPISANIKIRSANFSGALFFFAPINIKG